MALSRTEEMKMLASLDAIADQLRRIADALVDATKIGGGLGPQVGGTVTLDAVRKDDDREGM